MREKKVKVIILMAEEKEKISNNLWLTAMSNNPAFEFLHDKQEDIYKLTDGQPFHD